MVVPLEEEIKALKEKLRTTDGELQNFRNPNTLHNSLSKNQIVPSESQTDSPSIPQCSRCESTNSNLTSVEKESESLQLKNDSLKKDVERLREELEKEAKLRRELEEQWQEKREAHKKEVQNLTEKVEGSERELAILQLHFSELKEEINHELRSLITERENIHRYMETLQSDNEFLAGKYLATSEELQNQRIDLPNTVEELQELLLKCHENLIEARVGCEYEQRKCMSYLDEAQVLRDQLNSYVNERHSFERDTTIKIKALE